MYQSLYNIISNFLFNGDPSSFIYGELICEGIPAVICSLLFFLPFLVVWRIVKTFL